MSTPKPSLVKWVKHRGFAEEDDTDAEVREKFGQTPVIPLADLTALVEGLKRQYRGEACFIYKQAFDDLLTQLEAYRKEG